ncbi:hypothetical protein B0H14DRAFT_2593486 [Mycena olivaceomarginata]|nr:hypothetical protein B0H14DRAFT_2593486 [Mycena olivaceomarginata]
MSRRPPSSPPQLCAHPLHPHSLLRTSQSSRVHLRKATQRDNQSECAGASSLRKPQQRLRRAPAFAYIHHSLAPSPECYVCKQSAGVEASSLDKWNAGADRRRVNSAQMVRKLEWCSAPDTQRSAFAFALTRLPSAPCSHLLEYAVVSLLPIHAVSAQFHKPKFKSV